MESRTIGTGSWTVQVAIKSSRKDGDKTYTRFAVSGPKCFEIKDRLKSEFKATWEKDEKKWEFFTSRLVSQVMQIINDWMEMGRHDAREKFRSRCEDEKKCTCYIGESRAKRVPGGDLCPLSARNSDGERRQTQIDNFAHYKRRNHGDNRWDSSEDAECPACGLNLFGRSIKSFYNRRVTSCYHCDWKLEDD